MLIRRRRTAGATYFWILGAGRISVPEGLQYFGRSPFDTPRGNKHHRGNGDDEHDDDKYYIWYITHAVSINETAWKWQVSKIISGLKLYDKRIISII